MEPCASLAAWDQDGRVTLWTSTQTPYIVQCLLASTLGMRENDVRFMLRGVRTVSDFEYEYQMAMTNRSLLNSVDTVFMMPSLCYSFTSSWPIPDGTNSAISPPCTMISLISRELVNE